MVGGILIYGEDPGAVNYLAPLHGALEASGYQSAFFLAPSVSTYAQTRGISHKTLDGSDANALLAMRQPDLVITGTSENPDSPGLSLIDRARRDRIPTLGVIDMAVNAHRRFRGRTNAALEHAPDHLAVPDHATARAYCDLGMDTQVIHVVGHPHYDVIRARKETFQARDRAALRRELFPDAPTKRPVWVFVAEGIDQLNPPESHRSAGYTLTGHGQSRFRTSIVLEEMFDAAASLSPTPWIVLRLHPKMTAGDVAPFRAQAGAISEGGDPLPLVWAADAVIGMTSMLLLEAYLLGRPTLSILPRASEAAWLATTANNLTPVATTREEIMTAVSIVGQAPFKTYDPGKDEALVLPHNALGKLVTLCEQIQAERTSP